MNTRYQYTVVDKGKPESLAGNRVIGLPRMFLDCVLVEAAGVEPSA
jgi:hypothetical protein